MALEIGEVRPLMSLPMERDSILDLVRRIADELIDQRKAHPSSDLSLASGLAGHLVLFSHLSTIDDVGGRYSCVAHRCIDELIERLPEASLPAGLYDGIAGVAWAAQYTCTRIGKGGNADISDSEEVFEFFDEYLNRDDEFEYDLISGLAGIGLWALLVRNTRWRERLLSRIVRILQRSAVSAGPGLTWRTPACRQIRPQDVHLLKAFNLGLAHGIPGVVAFLSECLRQGDAPDGTRELLMGAVRWLASVALDDPIGMYSSYTGSIGPARNAWCYGDAGIALALVKGSIALGDAEAERLALGTLAKSAARQYDNSFVADSGLCHGSAGLMLTYQAIGHFVPLPLVAEARRYWLGKLMDDRDSIDRFCGFFQWDGVLQQRVADGGFLGGAAGVGLALLSQISGNLDWAYPLLMTANYRRAMPQSEFVRVEAAG